MNLALATVEDATNIGCRVRLLGAAAPTPTRYADKVQEAGVVIRNCSVVVVDRDRTPPEIVWRAGTVATVTRLEGDTATYDDGIRSPQTVRFVDRRPQDEQQAAPITVGDRVLIQGRSISQLFVADRIVDGQPAHPERLHAYFPTIVEAYSTSEGR